MHIAAISPMSAIAVFSNVRTGSCSLKMISSCITNSSPTLVPVGYEKRVKTFNHRELRIDQTKLLILGRETRVSRD